MNRRKTIAALGATAGLLLGIAFSVAAGWHTGAEHDDPKPNVALMPVPRDGALAQEIQEWTKDKPRNHFGDGRYEVGVDIVPGKYKTDGTIIPGASIPDKCYWARLKNLDGLLSSTIAVGYDGNGPQVVTIDPKDVGFESHECGTWRLVP